jgi:hypothetical protein
MGESAYRTAANSVGNFGIGYSNPEDDSLTQRFAAIQQIDSTVGNQLREQRPRSERG